MNGSVNTRRAAAAPAPIHAVSSAPIGKANALLTTRVISNCTEWQSLEGVWDLLLHASPDHTPWQSFSFLTAWWTHLGRDMPLRVIVVEREGVPCLVMPLQISRWNGLPGLPVRMLEPVSMIMDVNRPRLAIGALDFDVYQCAFDALWARRNEWDLIRIDEKDWSDAEVSLLRKYSLHRGSIFRQTFSHLVPYLDLRQSWPEYLKSKSQKLRKNLKTARKKLETMGKLELRRFTSQQDVLNGFQIFLDLHARSWKKQRKVEHSKSPDQRAFFAQWVHAMAQRDACNILILFCNDAPVAATIAFTDGCAYYSAQIVHDEQFAACSPGTLLESMEFELLMTEGRFTRYEFLGSFLSNKLRWTETASDTTMVVVFQRSLRTFLMDAYYSLLKPYIRPFVLRIFEPLLKLKKRWARSN